METNNEKTQEQKFNEDKKYLEYKFQRDLEKTKRKKIWISLFMIVLMSIVMIIVIHENKPVFTTLLNCGIVSIIPMFSVCSRMSDIRMTNMEKELSKKIEKETKYIKEFKEKYELLRLCKFTEIPISLRKTAETLLHTSMIFPPKEDIYEVIKAQETEIENMKIQLQVYSDCPERTFWQYFISW